MFQSSVQAGRVVMLNIATEYSRYPGPRLREDGPYSGQQFRDELLAPALHRAEQNGDRVVVDLDGARGFTASFLEEAFGGLIRTGEFSKDRLTRILEVSAKDRRVTYWRDRILEYIDNAAAVKAGAKAVS